MAQGSFSEQVNTTQGSVRLSRTDRKLLEDANRKKIDQFNRTKQRAEDIRQREFSNITSLQQYTDRYNAIPEDLKQFFLTPDELALDQQFISYTREYATQKKESDKIEAYNEAVRLFNQRIRPTLSLNKKNRPVYLQLKRLWSKYSNTDEVLEQKRQIIENKQKYGQGGTWTEIDVAPDGKESIVKQTVYYDGVGYNFDLKGLPTSEKPIYSYNPISNDVRIVGVESGAYQKSFPIENYIAYNKQLKDQYDKYRSDIENKNKTTIYPSIYFKESTIDTAEKTRGTVNTMPQTTLYSTREIGIDNREKTTPKFKETFIGDTLYDAKDLLVQGWNESAYYVSPLGISPFPSYIDVAKIPVGKSVNAVWNIKSSYLEGLKSGNEQKLEEWQQNKDTELLESSGVSKRLEDKYATIYQDEFNRQYSIDILDNKIDFETAKTQFEKSETAKLIGESYAREIGNERNKLPIFTLNSAEGYGIGLLKTANSLIPTTVGGAVTEGALIYTGYKALKMPYVANVLAGGFAVKGGLDFVNKNLSPTERFGGFVEAGISIGLLGYSGYRYATTPKVKQIRIGSRSSLTQAEKLLKKQGTIISQTKGRWTLTDSNGESISITQKEAKMLSESVVAGRRTQVTTRWREWLGLDPIYKGVPYVDRGKLYTVDGLGISFRGESGYDKAFRLIQKRYGTTQWKTTDILRYRKPISMVESYRANIFSVMASNGKNIPTIIEGNRVFDKRVLNINKKLGIKTAGGKSVEKISGKVWQVGKVDDDLFYVGKFDVVSKNKLKEYIQITASRGTGDKAYVDAIFGKGKTVKSIIKIPASQYVESSMAFKMPKNLDEAKNTKWLNRDGKVLALKDDGNYVEVKRFVETPKKPINLPKKVPIRTIKDYTDQDMSELTKILRKIYGTNSDSNKVINQVKDIISQKTTSATLTAVDRTKTAGVVAPSKYSFTDQIREFVGVVEDVKTVPIPAFASGVNTRFKLKDDVLVLTDEKIRSGYDFGYDIIQSPKEDIGLKELLAEKVTYTTSTETITDAVDIGLRPITFTPPKIFETPFKTPPFIFDIGKEKDKKKKLKDRMKKKNIELYGLLPDFTSRAIGIDPIDVTMRDVNKTLRKIQTGLEIRSGARLKILD